MGPLKRSRKKEGKSGSLKRSRQKEEKSENHSDSGSDFDNTYIVDNDVLSDVSSRCLHAFF